MTRKLSEERASVLAKEAVELSSTGNKVVGFPLLHHLSACLILYHSKLRGNFEKRLLSVMTTLMSRLRFEKSTMIWIIRHFWIYVDAMLSTTTMPLAPKQ